MTLQLNNYLRISKTMKRYEKSIVFAGSTATFYPAGTGE